MISKVQGSQKEGNQIIFSDIHILPPVKQNLGLNTAVFCFIAECLSGHVAMEGKGDVL